MIKKIMALIFNISMNMEKNYHATDAQNEVRKEIKLWLYKTIRFSSRIKKG